MVLSALNVFALLLVLIFQRFSEPVRRGVSRGSYITSLGANPTDSPYQNLPLAFQVIFLSVCHRLDWLITASVVPGAGATHAHVPLQAAAPRPESHLDLQLSLQRL